MLLGLLLIVSLELQLLLSKELEKNVSLEERETSDKQESSITKKLVTVSKPVKLSCTRTGWNSTKAEVVWFYKSCSGTDCILNQKDDGRKICGFQGQQPCSIKLSLEKPQSGLYKCYKMEEKIGYVISATLVITYDIQVLERNLEPEFLETPEDTEAFVGNSILFICKIKSSLPLHVNWYKRVTKSHGAFQYENKYYQLLNGTEVTKIKDIFLSKLKFKKLTLEDGGIYACGAINEAGIRYKEARLSVEESFEDIEEIPHRPFGDHWKTIFVISAIIFLLLVIKCMACIRLIKTSTSDGSQKNRRQRQVHQRELTSDPNDTSDYEHVITL